MRAGSTWLFQVLNRHPQIWMPPIKELHYFDNGSRSRWYRHFRMRQLPAKMPTRWDLRYFFRLRSDAWYASLFREGRQQGLLTGEITPAYAGLDDSHFERMLALNPDIRFIFQMRDPLDRAWSAYLKAARKNKVPAEPAGGIFSTEHVRTYIESERSNYIRTVERFDRLVRPDQIHYCFFDHMVADPKAFAIAIFRFLGIDENQVGHLIPDGRVNAVAKGRPVPDSFARVAAPAAIEQLEPLCHRFEGPPATWLARAKSVVAQHV
jgi:hypothetical protein